MQRKENIDLQVKKALDSIKPAYREDLWQGIEKQLPQKRNPFAAYWRSIAAVLLICGGTAGYYLTNNQNTGRAENQVTTAEIQIAQVESKQPEHTAGNPDKNTADIITIAPDKATAYNQLTENASGNNAVENNNSNSVKYSTSAQKNSISGKRPGKKQAETQTTGNNFNDGSESAIYANAGKYLDVIKGEIPLVENSFNSLPGATRYPAKSTAQKHRQKNFTALSSDKITTYGFWQNPAYTGSQGKLNLSFDDRFVYLNGERYSACQNNFGAEFTLPKSRFALGIYHQRFLKQFSLKTNSGLTASARLFNIGNGHVKAGFGATYLSSKLFKNTLSYSDQIDAKAGFVHTTRERNFTSEQFTVGADAGIWYSSPRVMAGFSAKNINQPRFGRLEEGQRLRREWQMAAGYSIPMNDISVTPWAEVRSTAITKQASAMLLLSYKNIITLGAGYTNISPLTYRGDVMVQASAEIKQRLIVYGMYGQNMEMQNIGLQQIILQSGLRYQIK